MPYARAREVLGPDYAAALWRLTERTLGRMDELAGDAMRRVGSLRLAADEKERTELVAEHEALLGDGFAGEWVDEPEGRLAGRYDGAILHPLNGALHPGRWTRAPVGVPRLLGPRQRARARVRRARREGDPRPSRARAGAPRSGEASLGRVWRNTVCAAGPRCSSRGRRPQSRPYRLIRALPASLPRNDHRSPATSGIPPNPPSPAAPAAARSRRSARARTSCLRCPRRVRTSPCRGPAPCPQPCRRAAGLAAEPNRCRQR
jgi:hypothetical protein